MEWTVKPEAKNGWSEVQTFDVERVLRHAPSRSPPAVLAWLTTHWGTSDRLRQVHALAAPRPVAVAPGGPVALVNRGPT